MICSEVIYTCQNDVEQKKSWRLLTFSGTKTGLILLQLYKKGSVFCNLIYIIINNTHHNIMNISWGFCVLLFILACLTIFWEYFLRSFTQQKCKLGSSNSSPQNQLNNKNITNPINNTNKDATIIIPSSTTLQNSSINKTASQNIDKKNESTQTILTQRITHINEEKVSPTSISTQLVSNTVSKPTSITSSKPAEPVPDLRKSREGIRRLLQYPDYASNRIKTQPGAKSIIEDQDREYEMSLLKDQEKEQREIEQEIQLQNERKLAEKKKKKRKQLN